MHVAAVCFCAVKLEDWFVLFLTRGRNCLPTLMRMQKRETYQMRTVLMKWRTTASWWTEMYVTCLVFSSISPPLSLPFSRGRLCVLVSSRWIVNCTFSSWWFMLKLSSGDGVFSSPVLPLLFISYTTVSLGCFCLFLSVCLFVLISSSSLFLFVPSSSPQLFLASFKVEGTVSKAHSHPVMCHTFSSHLWKLKVLKAWQYCILQILHQLSCGRIFYLEPNMCLVGLKTSGQC